MEIKELGHLVLYVKDLEKSIYFYEKILGWKKIDGPMNFPAAAFTSGRTHHELLLIEVGDKAKPVERGHRLGLYHFGLKIGDSDQELRDALIFLEKHNVPIIGATDHTVSHSLYIEDPDGNEIELYVDVPGVDWKKDPHLVLSPSKGLYL
ncbi:VOC family protein [Candidatus Peregrinibacteria bacterium]|nr:VOC family protein [Candidatus Peregrinibacteria bacterium]